MDSTRTVQQALAAVMAELPNIGKTDKSPEGFLFRGIEAMTRVVQPLLAKHGVVISPESEITQVVPSPAMKDGWQDVYLRVRWTITGPDGSTLTAQTNGIGRDRVDRGANKAQTQAYKYLLLHLLCVADGKDDGDSESYEHAYQDLPVDDYVPGLRSSVRAAVDKWVGEPRDEDRAAALREFFRVNDLPTVEKLSGEQCAVVIDHLMSLAAVEPVEADVLVTSTGSPEEAA